MPHPFRVVDKHVWVDAGRKAYNGDQAAASWAWNQTKGVS